jgi:hypothetical protein
MSFLNVCQGILVPAVQPSFQLSDFPLQIAPATHTSLELTSFSRSALTQVHSKDMSLAREVYLTLPNSSDMAGQQVNTVISQNQLLNLFNFNVSLGRFVTPNISLDF